MTLLLIALTKSPTEKPNPGVAISSAVLGPRHQVEIRMYSVFLAQTTTAEAYMYATALRSQYEDFLVMSHPGPKEMDGE